MSRVVDDFPDESKPAPARVGRPKYRPDETPYDERVGILPASELKRLLAKHLMTRDEYLHGERGSKLTRIEFCVEARITMDVLSSLKGGGRNVGPVPRKRVSQVLLRLEAGLIARKVVKPADGAPKLTPKGRVSARVVVEIVHSSERMVPEAIQRQVRFLKYAGDDKKGRIPSDSPLFTTNRSPRIAVVRVSAPEPRKLLKKW